MISLSPLRMLFWLVLGTFALACTCPAGALLPDRFRQLRLPLLPAPSDLRISRWRSWAVLGALNALFFITNTIDACYLWVQHRIPAGVNYSDYVHQGVGSLVGAVLLSALFLVLLLQQAQVVTGSRLLRGLSLLWIAQNVVLIGSVLLRLRLYVESYDLSQLRLYVGFFLLLVSSGFLFLAWRVVRNRDFGWLVSANLTATFVLFFTVQFLDTARWVADYNVNRWLREPSRTLDFYYLASLGASAYPALVRASQAAGRSGSTEALEEVRHSRQLESRRLPHENWRSRQFRPDALARALVASQLPGSGPVPASPAVR